MRYLTYLLTQMKRYGAGSCRCVSPPPTPPSGQEPQVPELVPRGAQGLRDGRGGGRPLHALPRRGGGGVGAGPAA